MVGTILMTFFFGRSEPLQSASSNMSIAKLSAEKKALVKRYTEDEQQFIAKEISWMAWQQRRYFLVSRYIDASRRLDYLASTLSK